MAINLSHYFVKLNGPWTDPTLAHRVARVWRARMRLTRMKMATGEYYQKKWVQENLKNLVSLRRLLLSFIQEEAFVRIYTEKNLENIFCKAVILYIFN